MIEVEGFHWFYRELAEIIEFLSLIGKNAKIMPPGIATATVSTQPYRLGNSAQVCLYLCTHMPKNAKL